MFLAIARPQPPAEKKKTSGPGARIGVLTLPGVWLASLPSCFFGWSCAAFRSDPCPVVPPRPLHMGCCHICPRPFSSVRKSISFWKSTKFETILSRIQRLRTHRARGCRWLYETDVKDSWTPCVPMLKLGDQLGILQQHFNTVTIGQEKRTSDKNAHVKRRNNGTTHNPNTSYYKDFLGVFKHVRCKTPKLCTRRKTNRDLHAS